MVAVEDVAVLDLQGRVTHGAGGVLAQDELLLGRHGAPEHAGLGVVVVVVLAEVVHGDVASGLDGLGELARVLPVAVGVGLVGVLGPGIAVHPHGAVAVEAMGAGDAARGVDRNLVVVDTEAVALSVAVGEEAGLEHPVRRVADAGHDVLGREAGLLDVLEVVVGVPVELEDADLLEGEVRLGPHLRQVEGVEVGQGLGLLNGHGLDVHGPAGVLALLDGLVQVALVGLAVLGDDGGGLLVREVGETLLGAEVELDPGAHALGVDEGVGVRGEAVHVAVGQRDAAVGHGDGHLEERLGQAGPEVPVGVGAAQVGAGVALDGVVEVDELLAVTEEEDGGVVADDVPVSLGGEETHGEAADVALGVGGPALPGDGGEAHEELALVALGGEDRGASELGNGAGDGEGAPGA